MAASDRSITGPPDVSLPVLPDEPRLDLTGLPAYAIDDEGNLDPDDAISLDGNRLWVHVADAAALVWSDSPADVEARGRGRRYICRKSRFRCCRRRRSRHWAWV